MATVFQTTLRPILFLGQFIGLINISYTLQPTGLIIRTSSSLYYSFLELSRMCLLMLCTYLVHVRGIYYVQHFRLVKFWMVIITARVSELWIVK